MPLKYKFRCGIYNGTEKNSIYKLTSTHSYPSSYESTIYGNTSLGVGWIYETEQIGRDFTSRRTIYRNITGFNLEAANSDDQSLLREIEDIKNGKPVEPAAADISTYSMRLALDVGIGVNVAAVLVASPISSSLSASTKWSRTEAGDELGRIGAGYTEYTKSLTLAQAGGVVQENRLILRPTSEVAAATTYTRLNTSGTYIDIERRNPAAKGAAENIQPAQYAVIIGNEDSVISYRYAQNYGGYPQAFLGIVAVNANTGNRVVIAKKRAVSVLDGAETSFTIPADTLTAGTWDIIISCAPAASADHYSTDDDFWTTGQTVRYTVKDNPTAGGVSCDGKPVPTVEWESTSQAAYQVRFGDYDSGARAGSETSLTVPKIFEDGAYPVRVRTATSAGEWSDWTDTYWATVRNVQPDGIVALTAETVDGNVRLSWTAQQVVTDPLITSESEPLMTSGGGVILAAMLENLSGNYAVFRNGKLIAVTDEAIYTDRMGGGEYQVIAVMEGLNYIPSNTVNLWPKIVCDMLSTDNGENWIPLRYTPELKSEPEDVRTEITYFYFAGREKPIAVNTRQKIREKNFSYRFKNRRDAQQLRDLNGAEVILKTSRGERIYGILENMTYTDAKVVTVSFSIRETDEEEDHVEYLV